MVFLAPILAAVAGWRVRQERHKSGVILFTLLTMWFLMVVAVQTYLVIHPRDPGNRSNFFQDLIHLKWLLTMSGQVNVPAIAGLLALLVIAGVALVGQSIQGTKPAKIQWSLVVGFAVVSFSMVVVTIGSEKIITPWMQFAARNHSALISFPLALCAILSTLYPSATQAWHNRQVISVISTLGSLSCRFPINSGNWPWSGFMEGILRKPA
jgi:phosphoglycerol transferase MdoB-like AlkP superfamily enzyme